MDRREGQKPSRLRTVLRLLRGAEPIIGYQRENRDRERRHDEDRFDRADHDASLCSPRKRSNALTSTVSKRSRMRNTKTPNTMKAIRTENATDTSTTSGIPLAPVPARIKPFSSDMKPTTWVI